MSEYIMGLGISVKICSLYEELVCLAICDSEHTLEYYSYVEKIRNLIDDETLAYDKLNDEEIVKYYNRVNNEDVSNFDSVKSRYYSKIKERKNILDSSLISDYPFTIDTVIYGKILLDALVKVDKQLLDKYDSSIESDFIYDLYSYHKAHKFTLLSINDFLERIAVDFNFNLSDMPNVNFDTIKNNFGLGKNFNKYLNKILYVIGIETINNLANSKYSVDVNSIYTNILYIAQLEVIISYLDKLYLDKLNAYCNSIGIDNLNNGKYISRVLMKSK